MTTDHLFPADDDLPMLVESILFVAQEPVDIDVLCQTLRRGRREVRRALDELDRRYDGGGIRLQRNGDDLQLVSAPEAGPYVERFLGLESRQRLSGAALEALAIIAYRQPMTRAGVEAVRGVNSDGAIGSLLARGLIEEVGRAPGPGRPVLFGTTLKFLEHFGLKSPSELPPLTGVTDALDDEDEENEAAPSEHETPSLDPVYDEEDGAHDEENKAAVRITE